MTIGIIVYDWILYYYFTVVTAGASSECNLLGPSACEVVNSDAYTLLLAIWISLQLTWVTMLLFVQFIQVSRGMTTYENMYGIQDASVASLQSAYTSTGTPLDPTLAAAHGHNPPSGSDGGAHAGHAHGHKHKGGFLSQWSRLLGVDTFIETATGRGAATASKSSSNAAARKKARKNPYSRGVLTNCRDFWCDPAPVFGRRDNGAAIIGGQPINWTDVYETPRAMDFGSGAGRRRAGGYEAVAVDEV